MNEKEQLIANLNNSQDIISQIEAKENEISATDEKYAKFRKSTGGETVGGRIACSVLLYAVMVVVGISIGGIFPSPLGDIVALVIFFTGAYLYISYPRKLKKQVQKAQQELEDIKKSPTLSWLPYDYRNTYFLSTITEAVQYDRVNSLGEALKLCDDKLLQQTTAVNNAIMSSIMR